MKPILEYLFQSWPKHLLPMLGYWGIVAMIVGIGVIFVGLVTLVRTIRGDPVKQDGLPQSRSKRLVGDVTFMLFGVIFFSIGYQCYQWQFD
jgi:hypothetical protein